MTHWPDNNMQVFARQAMNTRFEIFLHTPDRDYAAQAAAAAFDELLALENLLSRFLPNSEISAINALQPGESLVLHQDTFACLQRCFALMQETGGAFDITLAAQVDAARAGQAFQGQAACWQKTGTVPLQLDSDSFTITRTGEAGYRLDLGGFGKGYAVDRMLEVLQEWDAGPALVHGGRSSLRAGAAPAETPGWPVQLSAPDSGRVLRAGTIAQRAMGASGLQKQGHIIDPTTGAAIQQPCKAVWVSAHYAATADALSTAFMVMPPESMHRFCAAHPDIAVMVFDSGATKLHGEKLL